MRYEAGESANRLAAEIPCSAPTFRSLLRAKGIVVRGIRESKQVVAPMVEQLKAEEKVLEEVREEDASKSRYNIV
jgi:hypothetical protein